MLGQLPFDGDRMVKFPPLPEGYGVYLGSMSSFRKALLNSMEVEFECHPADIDEKALGDRRKDPPGELVQMLGRAKAASQRHGSLAGKRGVLLTGDQVVVIDGRICEKPETVDEALEFIKAYSSHFCSMIGSVVATDLETGQQEVAVERTRVFFKRIPEEVAKTAVNNGDSEVMTCAGAVMIEHPVLAPYVERLEGPVESIKGFGTHTVAELVSRQYPK